jgi:hypothetical protein
MDAPARRQREGLVTVRLGTEKSSKLIKEATETRGDRNVSIPNFALQVGLTSVSWGAISGDGAIAPVPIDDLRTGSGPYSLLLHDMSQRLVQAADAERLADEPGV